MLCLPCRRILLARRVLHCKPGRYIHHVSGSAFLLAAASGCQLCLMFRNQMSPNEKEALQLSQPLQRSPVTYSLRAGVAFLKTVEGKSVSVNDSWHLRIHYNHGIAMADTPREISYQVDFVDAAGKYYAEFLFNRQIHSPSQNTKLINFQNNFHSLVLKSP